MSEAPDYYFVLGISADASPDEVRSAYVRLMKRQFDGVSSVALPPERIRLMQEAYRCLRDPHRRARHDEDRATRTGDHLAAIRRRRGRLSVYDGRHRFAAPPPPAHWRNVAMLTGAVWAALGGIAWLCL